MVSLPEDFIPVITSDDIEKVLTDTEWEDNVSEAALFAVTHCSKNKTDSDKILRKVINYNITQQIKKLYLKKANPLPKIITWNNTINKTSAYELLEYIILQFCLLKETNSNLKHSMNLIINNKDIEIKLKTWCKRFEILYSEQYVDSLKIQCKKYKNKYIITLR